MLPTVKENPSTDLEILLFVSEKRCVCIVHMYICNVRVRERVEYVTRFAVHMCTRVSVSRQGRSIVSCYTYL